MNYKLLTPFLLVLALFSLNGCGSKSATLAPLSSKGAVLLTGALLPEANQPLQEKIVWFAGETPYVVLRGEDLGFSDASVFSPACDYTSKGFEELSSSSSAWWLNNLPAAECAASIAEQFRNAHNAGLMVGASGNAAEVLGYSAEKQAPFSLLNGIAVQTQFDSDGAAFHELLTTMIAARKKATFGIGLTETAVALYDSNEGRLSSEGTGALYIVDFTEAKTNRNGSIVNARLTRMGTGDSFHIAEGEGQFRFAWKKEPFKPSAPKGRAPLPNALAPGAFDALAESIANSAPGVPFSALYTVNNTRLKITLVADSTSEFYTPIKSAESTTTEPPTLVNIRLDVEVLP